MGTWSSNELQIPSFFVGFFRGEGHSPRMGWGNDSLPVFSEERFCSLKLNDTFLRGGGTRLHLWGVGALTPSVFTICCCILISSIHSLFIHLQKGTSPVQYIAGHLSKIYGLDWSPVNEYHLATASQDCHVKVRIMITNIYRWYSCILISYLCCSGSPMCSCLVTWFAIGWYQARSSDNHTSMTIPLS